MRQKLTRYSEEGQSIVIMAFGLVVLLGFLALAVDGGRAYTERRKAQNTADAAAMAAARELGSGASSITAQRVAHEVSLLNGYELEQSHFTVNDKPLDYGGTYDTRKTDSYEVSITIDSGIESAFAQLIFDEYIDVNATSNMEVRLAHTPLAGFGVVSLGSSCSSSANGSGVGVGGGGNSGGIALYGSTILINVKDPNDNCAFDPPSSTNNDGIYTYQIGPNGELITDTMFIVGSYSCPPSEACDNMSPTQSGFNNGTPLSDPLANLPAPSCLADYTGAGAPADHVYTPGTWDARDLGAGTYLPGIYCIVRSSSGEKFSSTGGVIDATSGVLFYFKDTGIGPPIFDLGGQAQLDLRAPGNGTTLLDCPDQQSLESMDTSDQCNYLGMAIFIDRGTPSTVELSGNGEFDIYGTIYGANATILGSGGGSDFYEIRVHGQVLTSQTLNTGNGSLQVWYEESLVYTLPPMINALE